MDESNAKVMWCPFSRVSSPILDTTRTWGSAHPKIGAETANRGGDPALTRCLGSGCMAWRWRSRRMGRGYCGLVGAE